MPLTYAESAQLRVNLTFQGRIASGAIKWADYILSNQTADLTNTITRKQVIYASEIFRSATPAAQTLQPIVVNDPACQAVPLDSKGDSTITDAALQSVVESAIGKVL